MTARHITEAEAVALGEGITARPWRLGEPEPAHPAPVVADDAADHSVVADCCRAANARLIAAAPDLAATVVHLHGELRTLLTLGTRAGNASRSIEADLEAEIERLESERDAWRASATMWQAEVERLRCSK